MAKSYYSIVLEHSADDVWNTIRRFDQYECFGEPSEVLIEEDKAGDQVSAIRRVTTAERTIRQVLLAHSDLERS